MDKKIPLILLGIGAGLAALICFISLSLYGKIYFFNGYEITKFAWIVSIGFTTCGMIGLISNGNWVIGVAVVLVIALAVSCDGSKGSSKSSSSSSSSSYRCNNCGGDGWDGGSRCVWCGGDGRTSWNP